MGSILSYEARGVRFCRSRRVLEPDQPSLAARRGARSHRSPPPACTTRWQGMNSSIGQWPQGVARGTPAPRAPRHAGHVPVGPELAERDRGGDLQHPPREPRRAPSQVDRGREPRGRARRSSHGPPGARSRGPRRTAGRGRRAAPPGGPRTRPDPRRPRRSRWRRRRRRNRPRERPERRGDADQPQGRPSYRRPRVGPVQSRAVGTCAPRSGASRRRRSAVDLLRQEQRLELERSGVRRVVERGGEPGEVVEARLRRSARPRDPRSPCAASSSSLKHTPWSIRKIEPSSLSRQWPPLRSALLMTASKSATSRNASTWRLLQGEVVLPRGRTPRTAAPSRSPRARRAGSWGGRSANRAPRATTYAATSRWASVPSGKSHSGDLAATRLVDREDRVRRTSLPRARKV